MIVLRAKSAEFETTYINLRDKPDWFLAISPHGKVPVLQVGDAVLFESNAIAEYLEEVREPRLYPENPIERAHHRAWTDFVPDFARATSGIYYAKSREELDAGLETARQRLTRLEEALERHKRSGGPWFGGARPSLVDAAYAPFLQRLALVEEKLGTGVLDDFPRVGAWAAALVTDPLVTGAVPDNFHEEFVANLKRRGALVAGLFEAAA